MLVRQTRNTFIRTNGDLGYIANQATHLDRRYNDTGIDYLNAIGRQPQHIEQIVRDKLLPLYCDATYDIVYADFISVVKDLCSCGFLVVGETEEELDKTESAFTLDKSAVPKPTTMVIDGRNIAISTQISAMEASKKNPYLMSLQFELTSRCNERCIHCYVPNKKKDEGSDLPFEKFKSIIDEFADMGGLKVCLSGGEIFLHKDLMPMILYCREKDMQIALLTNLVSLRESQIQPIADANVFIVQTSLYSMNQETHDMITCLPGSFAKTKRSIERLVAAGVPVKISCPIMKANVNDFGGILEYAHSIGIKVQTDFILMAEENLETGNLRNRISLEETDKIIREIINDKGLTIDDAYGKDTTFMYDERLFADLPVCSAGINNLCVSSNGDVYPCTGWQGFKAGNLNEQTLKDVWLNSGKLKELRQITNSSFEKCSGCEASEYCSVCMARNYNESGGDIFAINQHFCDVAFLNKRIHDEYVGTK